jgi:hypothetical protein
LRLSWLPLSDQPTLKKSGIAEHRVGGGVAAAGMTPDADAIEVDPRIALAQFLDAGDLIGQRVVAHVAEVGVVEGLGAPRRTHAVDRHHDEAQLGQRLVVAACRQEAAPRTEPVCGPGIDVVDDRIFLRRIEVDGLNIMP